MYHFLLFAAHASLTPTTSEKGMSLPWAIVIFGIALGLAITLTPPRRTYEVKKPKDE